MREQYNPVVADKLMEVDGTLSSINLEIGGD
jgi:hypothetical protein